MTRTQSRIALWSGVFTIVGGVIVILQFLGVEPLGIFGGSSCESPLTEQNVEEWLKC